MKLSQYDIEEMAAVARTYLQVTASEPPPVGHLARDFAAALVQVTGACVVGLPCERHEDAIHGQEAEELRAGVEQILKNTFDVDDEEAPDVLRALRKSLVFLLDRVDARDSLAFREHVERDDEVGAS